ncbi:MAG: DUF503 domain-containing protein [Actinobacteria bacterium]|nr:DUF503 domain-containing protein [Actinomycetota bacterium]
MVRAELYLPGATSLKDKRMLLRSMRARLTRSYGASFAEVGYQGLWQRAGVILAIAASDLKKLKQDLDAVEAYLVDQECEVLEAYQEVHEVDA